MVLPTGGKKATCASGPSQWGHPNIIPKLRCAFVAFAIFGCIHVSRFSKYFVPISHELSTNMMAAAMPTCVSSTFPTPEVPLFIKWEDYLSKTYGLYVIEIGGNVGKNTGSGDPIWEYVQNCGWSGAVLEPHPVTYQSLKKNYHDLEERGMIRTLNLAVGSSSGFMTMEGSGEIARLSGKLYQDKSKVEGGVVVVTLKELWDSLGNHIPNSGVDILVVDVEGKETDVLVANEMPSPKPKHVLFEIAHLSERERFTIDLKLRSEGYRQRADLIHRDEYALRHKMPPQDRLYSLQDQF